MNIKYLIITLITLVNVIMTEAKTTGYIHKPLAAEGCQMEYNVTKKGDDYYIIVTATSDRLYFLENPEMKIRTFENEVISLKGEVEGNNRGSSAGYIIGNTVISSTEIKSSALFQLTPEQFIVLSHGIAKIRLSMRPMNHEKEFRKDKIGHDLYQLYLNEKKKDEEF